MSTSNNHPLAVAAGTASAAIKVDPAHTPTHVANFFDSFVAFFEQHVEPVIAAAEPIANVAATVDPAIAPEVAAGEAIVKAGEGLINGANVSSTASTLTTVVQPAVAVAEAVDPKLTPAITTAETIAAEAEDIANLVKTL